MNRRVLRSSALAVFARFPAAGRVKTRLISSAAGIFAADACEIYRACLCDTLSLVSAVRHCQKWLFVAASAARAQSLERELRLRREWQVLPQHGADLGARMRNALGAMFAAGAGKTVIVGSDTPWMGPERIARALELLDSAEVVLGPTADGGYYMLGARRVIPEMFRGMAWGTPRVLPQTLRALARSRVVFRLLPGDFDLDRPADLARAARLLRRDPTRAPALSAWVRSRRRGF